MQAWFAHDARGYAISPQMEMLQNTEPVAWNATRIAYKPGRGHMTIVFPHTPAEKAPLLEWAKRLPVAIRTDTAYPVAVVRDGRIAAVVIYHEWRGANIEMSIVADTPRWATKQTVAFLLGFPFLTWDVRRITALVDRRNKRSRKLVEGLGFRLEGVMRVIERDGDDILWCTE